MNEGMNQSMNQCINQSSNQSSTIPQLDSTNKMFASSYSTTWYGYLCAGGCQWCGCSLKSSKIWGVSAGFTTILRANSLPYFFLVCQNLSQRKSRWTITNIKKQGSRRDISWPVFNPQFKKRLSWGVIAMATHNRRNSLLRSWTRMAGWHDIFKSVPVSTVTTLTWALQREKICPGVLECCIAASPSSTSLKGEWLDQEKGENHRNGLRTGRRRSQAIFGGFLPFLDRATRLWPWPGFKLQVCHTLNKTCRKHAKFAQIQHEISRSTFQLKMRHTFGFPIPSATEQSMRRQWVATKQGQPQNIGQDRKRVGRQTSSHSCLSLSMSFGCPCLVACIYSGLRPNVAT